jgi:hypothetical protein
MEKFQLPLTTQTHGAGMERHSLTKEVQEHGNDRLSSNRNEKLDIKI